MMIFIHNQIQIKGPFMQYLQFRNSYKITKEHEEWLVYCKTITFIAELWFKKKNTHIKLWLKKKLI